MDPANESRWEGRVFQCHACAARDRKQAAFQKDPDAQLHGTLFIPVERH